MTKYYSYPKFILSTLVSGVISCEFESDDSDSHDNDLELPVPGVFYAVEVPSWVTSATDPVLQPDLALLPTVSASERRFQTRM